MLREQQMVKQQEGLEWGYLQRQSNTQMGGNRVRNSDVTNGGRKIGANMGLSPSAWPHVQQAKQQFQYVCGNGMRGVFSGKRGSTGTGVFLPRSVADCSAKSRIKPGEYKWIKVLNRGPELQLLLEYGDFDSIVIVLYIFNF